MSIYDFSHNEQPQPKPCSSGRRRRRCVSTYKRVEDRILHLGGNRYALIHDSDHDIRSLVFGDDVDVFRRSVNHGIYHEIENDLAQPLVIPAFSKVTDCF
jgi:hypothetical protein